MILLSELWERFKDIYPPVPVDGEGNVIGEGFTVYNPVIVLGVVNLRLAPTVRIDSFCKLEVGMGTFMGSYVHVASFCHINIGGGVTIMEEGASTASGTKLISGSNVPGLYISCSAVAPGNVISRSFVHMKRNSVTFANAVILPGCIIGENAVVAAGAVVRCDIPAREIWGGVPACKIGEVSDVRDV